PLRRRAANGKRSVTAPGSPMNPRVAGCWWSGLEIGPLGQKTPRPGRRKAGRFFERVLTHGLVRTAARRVWCVACAIRRYPALRACGLMRMNQARANAKGVPKTVSGICLTIHIVNRGLSDAAGSEVYGRCYETDTK